MARFDNLIGSIGALTKSLKEAGDAADGIGIKLAKAKEDAFRILPALESQAETVATTLEKRIGGAMEGLPATAAKATSEAQDVIMRGVEAAAGKASEQLGKKTAAMGAEVERSAAESLGRATSTIEQTFAETVEQTRTTVESMVSQVDELVQTANQNWREQTNSTVNITIEEAIAKLEAGGRDMEEQIAKMLKGIAVGLLDVDKVRESVRSLGAEAVAIFNSLPLHELQNSYQELRDFAQETSTTTEQLIAEVSSRLQSVNADLAAAFDAAAEGGVDALQKLKDSLGDLFTDFPTAGLENILDEIIGRERRNGGSLGRR